MKAATWIISFAIGVTMMLSLIQGTIVSGLPRIIIFILMCVMFYIGGVIAKQDFEDIKEDVSNEMKRDDS